MVGDIQGYCVLNGTKTIIGYTGDPKELLMKPLRILDVAVDNSGFIVVNPQGTAAAMVDMEDVYEHFLCDSVSNVLIPPGLNFLQKMIEVHKRMTREGGYSSDTKKLVVAASLSKGKFYDDFLFDK